MSDIEDDIHNEYISELDEIANLIKTKKDNNVYLPSENLGKLIISINTDLERSPEYSKIIYNSFGIKKVSTNTPRDTLVLIKQTLEDEQHKKLSVLIVEKSYSYFIDGIETFFVNRLNLNVSEYLAPLKGDIYIQSIITEILSGFKFYSFFSVSSTMNVWLRLLIAVCIPILVTFTSKIIGFDILIKSFFTQIQSTLIKPEFIVNNNIVVAKDEIKEKINMKSYEYELSEEQRNKLDQELME